VNEPQKQVLERPYWAEAYDHVTGCVFRRKDNGQLVLSAERTWAHLKENVRRVSAAVNA
jgi:hypothetical protein